MSESQPTPELSDNNHTELEKLIRSSGPWLATNATTLIYALAAFLAVAAVVVYMKRSPAGEVEASRALLLAVSPEDFRDVADDFPNTKIGIWARLRQGDRLRDDAVAHMFSDRPLGLGELVKSEAAYEELAHRTDISEEVRERVLIGLARIADTRLDGTQEAADFAVAAYQRVLDEFGSSIDKQQCESRIAQISTDASKTWCAWFHELKPAPDVPGIPGIDSLNPGTDAAGLGNEASTSPDAKPAPEGGVPEKAEMLPAEKNAEPKAEPKPEPKPEPKAEPKPEPKPEPVEEKDDQPTSKEEAPATEAVKENAEPANTEAGEDKK